MGLIISVADLEVRAIGGGEYFVDVLTRFERSVVNFLLYEFGGIVLMFQMFRTISLEFPAELFYLQVYSCCSRPELTAVQD